METELEGQDLGLGKNGKQVWNFGEMCAEIHILCETVML